MADSIFKQVRMQAGSEDKAVKWYRKTVLNLSSGITGEQLIRGQRLSSVVMPGYMYMFLYDPKYKAVLPYYDTVPLVLPFSMTADGFIGINLHYLPYGARFKLLGELKNLAIDKRVNENTKIKISWQILNSSSRYLAATACVKRYLNSHLRSRFLKVNYEDWETAAALPVEGFKNNPMGKVWRDVKRKHGYR
jgi:hypothetical protein